MKKIIIAILLLTTISMLTACAQPGMPISFAQPNQTSNLQSSDADNIASSPATPHSFEDGLNSYGQLLETVNLGCCVTDIAVRDEALLGVNSVAHRSSDFIMTLNSDSNAYNATEIINIWGTLEYIGDNESIEIWHGCPFMMFSISGGNEIDFGSVMGGSSVDVLVSSVLEKGKVYHFDYQKSGGWSADDPNAEYWETFFSEKDLILPVGEFSITLVGDFGFTERIPDSASGLIAELRFVVER